MATCLEGKVHLWDMKTKHVKAGYAMHEQRIEKARHTVWGGRFLRQNREVRRLEKEYHLHSTKIRASLCENLAFSFLKVFATLGGGGSLTLWKYKYPAQRVSKQEDGSEVGVAGTMEKLQESQIADQPISGIRLIKLMCRKGFSIGSSSCHFSKLTVFFENMYFQNLNSSEYT